MNREFILQKVRECHYFNNLVEMEGVIRQAEREFKEDQEFINALKGYRGDLKIKKFIDSLGDNEEGFNLFMINFGKQLLNGKFLEGLEKVEGKE